MENLIIKYLKLSILTVSSFFIIACSDYLDVVPDNVATVDYAFKTRYQAEGFLYGLYSFLPEFANTGQNPALMGGDEIWTSETSQGTSVLLWPISFSQGSSAPLANYWSSKQSGDAVLRGGKPMFTALRDCNIFLENIHIPFDLMESERLRWIAEAKFLKAFYHFWLFRMYGPIPLIKENLPIDAVGDQVRPYREPVDDVVEYIATLIDEALPELPLMIEDQANEMGRITQPIALALKAQLLTLAASPLFNGNPDYASVVDGRGIDLFPQTYSQEKWEKAATALKEAIDVAESARHQLYDFGRANPIIAAGLNEKTILAMQVRGAATERWNEEIIWGDSQSNTQLIQASCQPFFNVVHQGGSICNNYGPTQRMAEQFYTQNGVPIEEDKEWQSIDPMGFKVATDKDKFYISQGFRTLNLYYGREARFYGAISFDGSILYGNGRTTDTNPWVVNLKNGTIGAAPYTQRSTKTGYVCKKLLNFKSAAAATTTAFTQERYAFPIIRLADLYLMYAEALNESKNAPDDEVYHYIDVIRNRTGLPGVIESWRDHSLYPDKPFNKEGMRDIIRQERLNELAFEGSRFWDLRRWKLAEVYMNKPIRGLNIFGETDEDFYTVKELYPIQFEKKDYLWPIRISTLSNNTNLVQNNGW